MRMRHKIEVSFQMELDISVSDAVVYFGGDGPTLLHLVTRTWDLSFLFAVPSPSSFDTHRAAAGGG
jgi:hypothetical protein